MESTHYNTIYADLIIETPSNVDILSMPNVNNLSERKQIETLQQFISRSNNRKNRKQTLLYTYYLGQLMETSPELSKMGRRILSRHYYVTAIRTYYIFEFNPEQIMRTQNTTLGTIRKLKKEEYMSLLSEV